MRDADHIIATNMATTLRHADMRDAVPPRLFTC